MRKYHQVLPSRNENLMVKNSLFCWGRSDLLWKFLIDATEKVPAGTAVEKWQFDSSKVVCSVGGV
jgi:hypothetical protein